MKLAQSKLEDISVKDQGGLGPTGSPPDEVSQTIYQLLHNWTWLGRVNRRAGGLKIREDTVFLAEM